MRKVLVILIFILMFFSVHAGPPFNTDDPEPVEHKHYEFYISSINFLQSGFKTGTLPHFEINYGLIPNLQIHAVMPLNYSLIQNKDFNYGYANTELGFKYRFLNNKDCLSALNKLLFLFHNFI